MHAALTETQRSHPILAATMPLFGEPDDLANRRHLAALDRRRLVGLAALDRCRLAAPLIVVALTIGLVTPVATPKSK